MSATLAIARAAVQRWTPSRRRPILLYGVFTLVLFVVFLAATFPYDLVIARALRDTVGPTWAVDVLGSRVGWTLATSVDDLRLRPTGRGDGDVLSIQSVRVAPSLLGLLRGSPYPLRANAALYGGRLTGTIDPRPASFTLDGALSELDLGRYAGFAQFADGRLRGHLTVTTALDGDLDTPTTLNGRIAVNVIGLGLEGVVVRGITVPDLHFAQLQLGGTVTNGRVDLTEVRGAGTELNLAGGGHMVLRMPLPTTLLNLEATITPTAAAPQGLRVALQLLPGDAGPDDARTVRITGSLAHPALR